MEEVKQLRLDVLVPKKYKDITRSQANKLITSGKVKVGNKVETKPSAKFREDVDIKLTITKNEAKTDIPISIIYEDNDVLVINKPIGILAHSKGTFNEETTIAEWLSAKLNRTPVTNRDGIVHRLDRATSGVMILAKDPGSSKKLSKQFSSRKAVKKYIAVVSGHLSEPEALIDMPIERNPKKPQTFRTGANGKTAQTKYKVLKENKDYSMLELTPTTGRTHQLRVHLSAISHPIVGDVLYGGKSADRMFLHAKSLEITLPDSSRQTFSAPLPKEFKDLIS